MLIGRKNPAGSLSPAEIADIVTEGLASRGFRNRTVLVLVPDATRKAPVDLLFGLIFDRIGGLVRKLDVLVATGTHRPPTRTQILARLGIRPEDAAGRFARLGLFAHAYADPNALRHAGTLPGEELAALTGGLYREDLPVTINKRVFEYDVVLVLGPVTPHEAAGFSGGNKYLIPGVAGTEVIAAFHWLAALITNPRINGFKDNPARRILDRGAALLGLDILSFSFVVGDEGGLGCLYVGTMSEAWSRAADYSAAHHIIYEQKPYSLVVGIAPPYLNDLWVGGKVMYKLEPVLEDGGEVVIYAPHISELSQTHGESIREVGYHVRDYFLAEWERFRSLPRLVLAHSTNVRGIGTYAGGAELPRVRVTLATGISSELCDAVNLGYRDPRDLDLPALRDREDVLVVEEAGQALYRLESEREPASP